MGHDLGGKIDDFNVQKFAQKSRLIPGFKSVNIG